MATADKPARIDAPALAEFVRRLVEIYHPLRIYLFGSRARGDWGPDSDYDLMIVVPDDAPEEKWQREAVQEAQSETRAWSDVLVWSQDRFDGRLHLKASFPSTILREGALVYTADPVRPHDTAEWLALAQENLRAAQVALTLPYYEDVLLHALEAGEQAMKAFLTWDDTPARTKHDVGVLAEQCSDLDESLRTALQGLAEFSNRPWRAGRLETPDNADPEEARAALQLARDTLAAILERLPPEARPDPV